MDRLGGKPALEAAVEEFYFRVLCDEDLLDFFKKVDMALLKAHQTQFMTIAFTEIPKDFDVAAHIVQVHSRVIRKGLNEKHFDKVASHLVESLFALGISRPLVDEVVSVVSPLREVFKEAARKHREESTKASVEMENKTKTSTATPSETENRTETASDYDDQTLVSTSNNKGSRWKCFFCRGHIDDVTQG